MADGAQPPLNGDPAGTNGVDVDPGDVNTVLAALTGAAPRCGSIRVIAIDGPSGSGKSTLATAVAETLASPIVQMDDIFPGWDGLEAAVPLLVEQVLEPLSRCEPATYRVWDWPQDRWGSSRTVPVCEVVVIEGCASSVGAAGTYAAVRVWVEAPLPIRMERGLARDGAAYRPHWQRWAAQESRMYAADNTRANADVIIRTG